MSRQPICPEPIPPGSWGGEMGCEMAPQAGCSCPGCGVPVPFAGPCPGCREQMVAKARAEAANQPLVVPGTAENLQKAIQQPEAPPRVERTYDYLADMGAETVRVDRIMQRQSQFLTGQGGEQEQVGPGLQRPQMDPAMPGTEMNAQTLMAFQPGTPPKTLAAVSAPVGQPLPSVMGSFVAGQAVMTLTMVRQMAESRQLTREGALQLLRSMAELQYALVELVSQ